MTAVIRAAQRRRELLVSAGMAALLAAVAVVSLTQGDYPLSVRTILAVITGGGTELDRTVVLGLRLARLVVAALAGAALALAGALMQSLLRNPLASPDLLGINAAGASGAVLATAVWGWSGASVSAAAFTAAVAAAFLLLSLARGEHANFAFLICGVGLAFVGTALTAYLLKRANVNLAQSALIWTVGSVNAANWGQASWLALALLLAAAGSVLVAAPLAVHRLGTQVAASLGVATTGTRMLVMSLAALVAASAVAVVGPVPFVALGAAPIARALARGRLALAPAALLGAVLLVSADLAAQRLAVPVGVVTGALGSPYLLWLVAKGRP